MSEEKYQYFVGLDIGTTAVRCVVGELAADTSTPNIIGFASVENSGLRKGNVAHIDEVADAVIKAVQDAERMSGRQISGATININGSHVQGVNSKGVIAVSSPDRQIGIDDRMRVEEAATIVQLPPNKDIIQVFAKNYRLDGQENIKDPVGMHGVRLEVDTHILVASSPALKSLDHVLERAELRANHRTVTSLAAAEAVLDRKQKESGVAVVDIGAATTNLVVIEDGEIEHIAVIPMGGTNITNDLAIGLKTELEIAEVVKVKHASLLPAGKREISFVRDGETLRFDPEMLRIIVEARVEEILEYVDKELKRIHRSRKLPGGLVLTGGTSKLPGIVELTRETMQLPARVGSWKHIKKVVDGLDEQRFTAAVGLMLMDMILGPTQGHHGVASIDAQPGLMTNVTTTVNSLFKKLKK